MPERGMSESRKSLVAEKRCLISMWRLCRFKLVTDSI
jgi:hypothetical protein